MSIKTKSAKYAKMQRGEYQSKICPYGYRKSADGRMEPDPEAAAVVQLIFSLSADGMNAAAITWELFRRSIPTPCEYKAAHGNHTHDISRTHGIWSTSTILRILADERYTGVYVLGKRAVLSWSGAVYTAPPCGPENKEQRQGILLFRAAAHAYFSAILRQPAYSASAR